MTKGFFKTEVLLLIKVNSISKQCKTASKTWLNGKRKSIFDAEKGAVLHYLRRFFVL